MPGAFNAPPMIGGGCGNEDVVWTLILLCIEIVVEW